MTTDGCTLYVTARVPGTRGGNLGRMSIADILLNPLFWAGGLVLWYLLGKAGKAAPTIFERDKAKKLRPRSFVRGGGKPDKLTAHVRAFLGTGNVIGTARFNLVEPGVRVVTREKDADGNFVVADVDIIVWNGPEHVVLVQVDDMAASTSSVTATYKDLTNSRALASTGWPLVRLRIGPPLDERREAWRILDPLTCVGMEEFDPNEVGSLVTKAISKARPVDPKTWDKKITAVTDGYNAEGLRAEYMRNMPNF